MTCEQGQQNIILAQYGELPDELNFPLEQHLAECEDCMREWNALQILHTELSRDPVLEPSPNFLTASRMRLEEALDEMPAKSVMQRVASNGFRWLGFMQGAPALATLLLGAGFLGGTALSRYQFSKIKQPTGPVILSSASDGAIASVSGITQTPNSEVVQVSYNRLVPEKMQGTLDDPQIRQLLMLGTKLATDNQVHASSVALLSNECLAGHACDGENTPSSTNIRGALLASLRTDKSPEVRLKALQGLQPYVAQDEKVRNAVLDSLLHDGNPEVRTQAISLLTPVGADSSVRHVLRTVSSQDVNPAIRTASFQALQGTSDIQ